MHQAEELGKRPRQEPARPVWLNGAIPRQESWDKAARCTVLSLRLGETLERVSQSRPSFVRSEMYTEYKYKMR